MLRVTGPGRVCVVAGTALCAGAAWGDDVFWGNISGGTFNVGTNWIGGVVPGAGDVARFGRTRPGNPQQAYTVSFSNSPSNIGMVVEDDAVTLDLNGNAYVLTQAFEGMDLGTSTSFLGSLTIVDGVVATVADGNVRIGAATNASGRLTVSTGAQFLGWSLQVGLLGPGTLVVQGGGDFVGTTVRIGISTVGAAGTATVTGAGSAMVVEDLILGSFGPGTLTISAGGRVESTEATLGIQSGGAIGTVTVNGAGSRWTNSGAVFVGEIGQGVLNITGGAVVESTAGVAGGYPTGSGAINVAGGSQWINTQALTVGSLGQGTMSISGGSLVQSARGSIGSLDIGSVTVDGVGTRWINSEDLTVGNTYPGTLSITGGAEVACANGFIARDNGQSSANVSGAGSRWTMTGDLSVGGDIHNGSNGGSALLTIEPGGLVTTDAVFIYPQSRVDLNGGTLDAGRIALAFTSGGVLALHSGVLHVGLVEFNMLNEGATLAPGHSAGHTSIHGAYAQRSAATMEIEVGGASAGQFDTISVAGSAALGGSLRVSLLNGFVPNVAQTFTVLTSPGISGAFDNVASGQRVAVDMSGNGGTIAVYYGPGSPFGPTRVVLTNFLRPCAADFNHDNTVDSQDYFDFINDFFSGDADFNGDTVTDSQDFFDFLEAFFRGCQ